MRLTRVRVAVDFEIWTGPASVWGQVSGHLEVPRKPTNPAEVDIPSLPQELLEHPTEVHFVSEEDGSTLVAFIAFAKSHEAAVQLAEWFEGELGLDPWPYGDE